MQITYSGVKKQQQKITEHSKIPADGWTPLPLASEYIAFYDKKQIYIQSSTIVFLGPHRSHILL